MSVRHFMLENRYVRLLPRARSWLRPAAYHPPTRERVEVRELELHGEEVEPPPGPLGPRAEGFNCQQLTQCWLPEEEWRRWWQAGRFRAGREALVRRVEREILRLEMLPDFPLLLINPELAHGRLPEMEPDADPDILRSIYPRPSPKEREQRKREFIASIREEMKHAVPCTFEDQLEDEEDDDEPGEEWAELFTDTAWDVHGIGPLGPADKNDK